MSVSRRLPAPVLRLWISTLASGTGDGLALVAFPLLALTLTRNPLAVAGVAVAAQLPALLFGPVAGALVDRSDAGRLAGRVQALQLAVFVAFGAAVLAGRDSLALLYLVVAALGCCDILFSGCTSAALPAMVGDADLERANSGLWTATLTGRELVGQALGGAAFALGRALPLLADAASFAVAAAVLRGQLPRRPPAAPRRVTIRADIAEGVRYFRTDGALRQLAGVIAVFAGCQAGVVAVLVLYATGPLHLGRSAFGLLCAVAPVGGIAGSWVAPRLTARLGGPATITAAGLAAAAAYLLLASVAVPAAAAAALVLEGAAVSVGNTASMAMRQRMIPAELLGRVGVTFRMILLSACVGGSALGGALTSALGVRSACLVMGVAQLAAVAITVTSARRRGPVIDLTAPEGRPAGAQTSRP